MRRAAEIAAFLGLSAAVHAGVVAGFGDAVGGPQGQGAGGADRVTLQAAPESLAALAGRWTEAPVVAPDPVAMQAPTQPEVLRPPMPDSAVPRIAMPRPSDPVAGEPAPRRPEPAPPPSRPAPGLSQSAPALPVPDAALVFENRAETAPSSRTVPALTPPEGLTDPTVTTQAPPPPGSTALATAVSPRPAQRPSEPPPRPAAEAPASAPPSAPQPARVAAGSGTGATQGAAQSAPQAPPTPSAADRQSLMARWGGQIMARIERARPRVHASGQVVLALQVARSGELSGLSVARSSGDPALDEAALSAVRRAGRFPAAPDGLTDATYAFSLPIRFR